MLIPVPFDEFLPLLPLLPFSIPSGFNTHQTNIPSQLAALPPFLARQFGYSCRQLTMKEKHNTMSLKSHSKGYSLLKWNQTCSEIGFAVD